MTITSHSRSRRITAAAGAIALAAVGVLGFAGSATADPIGTVGNIVSPDPGTSSIVVHKYTKTPANGTTPGNGTQATPAGSPIAGVTFSLQLVSDSVTPLNLLTNPGWANASSIASAWGGSVSYLTTAPRSLGTASTRVTDASGIATFANLPYGLYLVQETASPTNVTDRAAPFLVTVPFPTGPAATNPTNPNEWLYAVHVYPKNSVTGIDKIVNTTDAGFRTAGDYVSWTINSTIPVLATGVNLTTFTVTDTVTDGQLDFVTTVPSGIAPRSVRVLDSLGVNQSSGFVAGTDYTISPAAPVASDTTSTVVFTSTGRTKLQAFPGGTVEFVVPTKVVAVPVGGTITNDSALDVNNSHLTDPATTDFGQLRVLKFSTTNTPGGGGAVTTKTPLAGAIFALYVDLDQDGVADAGEVAAANQVTVNGQNTWTSAATTGLLDIPALKVGRYLLVEQTAPTGYALDSTPRPVTVTAGLSTTTPAVNYQEISNSQISPWALPFTGGNGVMTFTIVGAGLMALALGFAFVALRRRKQAEQA